MAAETTDKLTYEQLKVVFTEYHLGVLSKKELVEHIRVWQKSGSLL